MADYGEFVKSYMGPRTKRLLKISKKGSHAAIKRASPGLASQHRGHSPQL